MENNKTFFSDKVLNCNKMMLSGNNQITSDETTIADTMNTNFFNITKKLKLKPTETETPKEFMLIQTCHV